MALDLESALSILNEAKDGGYEDQPIPEDERKIIERAEYFYHEAQKAFDEGMRDNTVQGILWIGGTALDEPVPDKVKESYPRRSSGGLSEGDERETDNFQVGTSGGSDIAAKENLPVPAHIEGDADPMPRDLTKLTDKNVRKLSGEYNAYLARTIYLLAVESSDLANSEHLLDAARAKAFRTIDTIDPVTEKPKLAKVIEAEILGIREVAELTSAVAKHQQMVIMWKALKEIYGGNVDRLSREWTMRQNEWEKSK